MNILNLLYACSATPILIFLITRAFRAKGKNKKLFFSFCSIYILIGLLHFFLSDK